MMQWPKKLLGVAIVAAMALAFAGPGIAHAQGDSGKPINLGIFDPIQIVKNTENVHGLRLSLIYGRNAGFEGLDLSLVGRWDGGGSGVMWSGVGLVEGDFTGWQSSWLYNGVKGHFTGFQEAAINNTGSMKGFQLGLVNITDTMSGFQLGFVNMAENLDGLQIGILNIAKNANGHPILPIVNWKF